MECSFFKNHSFKILEREIVDENYSFNLNPQCLKVLDFCSWKLKQPLGNFAKISKNSKSWQEIYNEKIAQNTQNQPVGVCVTTIQDVEHAASFAQFLYIPGEFCRQSDIFEAVKAHKIPVVVEKGIFLSPNDTSRLVEKLAGLDFVLVECGSSFGYSDVVFDPRSLYCVKEHSPCFGVALSDLFMPEGTLYPHRPKWLNTPHFINSFVQMSLCFKSSFFVIKCYGNGEIQSETILKMVN